MKKTKFAVLFTALVAMLGLSSCLSDPDPYSYNEGIFRTEGFPGYYKFKDAFGGSITPVNQSVITGDLGDFAYIYYKYDSRNITQGTTNIDAELQMPPVPIRTVTSMEAPSVGKDAPFVSPQPGVKEVLQTRYLHGKTDLFVNLCYDVRVNKNDNSKNDLLSHQFYIWHDEEAPENDSETLVLRLGHKIMNDVSVENEQVLSYSDTRRINLADFLYSVGDTPKKIIIKYKVAETGLPSEGEDEEEVVLKDVNEPFELDYESFLKIFQTTNQ